MQSPNGNMRAQALSIDKPIGQPYAEFVCYLARILSMFAPTFWGPFCGESNLAEPVLRILR